MKTTIASNTLFLCMSTLMIACLCAASARAQELRTQEYRRPGGYYAQPDASSPGDGQLRSSSGIVRFVKKIQIPAVVEGKLTQVKVREGSAVSEGDLIAVIDDVQAKLGVRLKDAAQLEAKLNAKNDVNRRFAESSKRLADAIAKSYVELVRKNVVSFFEKEQKELEAEKAGLQIEMADQEHEAALIKFLSSKIELEMAQYEVDRRQIKAPFSGYIEERAKEEYAREGEWVQAGTPIATLVQMDTLRVEADLPALGTNDRVYAGAPCEVLIYNNGVNRDPIRIDAELMFVSAEINSVDNYRVWTEVKNPKDGERWQIKPGMAADIIVK